MISCSRRNALVPPCDLQLQNGLNAIVVGEKLGVSLNRMSLGAVSEIHRTSRRKLGRTVSGDY